MYHGAATGGRNHVETRGTSRTTATIERLGTETSEDPPPQGDAGIAPDPVTIRLLGLPEISGRAVGPEQPSPVVFHLLAYLLINASNTRTSVCTAFWPDAAERQARRRLSTAVWRLRKYFEAVPCGGDRVVVTSGDRLAFRANPPFWADITAFDAIVGRAGDDDPDDVADLERAVEWYRGDLLEGCYEEWLLPDRERYRQRLITGLERLADWHHRRGNPERAIHYGLRLLDLDPLRESIHRAIMQLHIERGEPTEAIRQFERCRQILDDELGAPPMPETLLLAARIRQPLDLGSRFDELTANLGLGGRRPDAPGADDGTTPDGRPDAAEIIQCLRQARDQASALSQSLADALDALERLGLDSR